LLDGAESIQKEANTTQKTAGRIRRKSKDLEDQLNEMEVAPSEMTKQGRMRRKSKDFTDDEITKEFEKFLPSGTAAIEPNDAIKVMKALAPDLSSEVAQATVDRAKKDQEGKITLESLMEVWVWA